MIKADTNHWVIFSSLLPLSPVTHDVFHVSVSRPALSPAQIYRFFPALFFLNSPAGSSELFQDESEAAAKVLTEINPRQ